MRVCIVGNGPTAQGHGAEIDACDFVVRIKAFWRRAAENAGKRIDAWAWYGMTAPGEPDYVPVEDIPIHVPRSAQQWFTDCEQEIEANGYQDRLAYAASLSRDPLRHISNELRNHAAICLNSYPTTGFLAVCMAIEYFPTDDLSLYGFDCTTRSEPKYGDANGAPSLIGTKHNTLAEKRAIAKILNGEWLGGPCSVRLEWLHMPELGGENV